MKNKNILITVVIAIAVGAIGFFGGMQYQKMQRASFTFSGGQGQFAGRATGGNTRFGGNSANRPVSGEIVSVDSTGVTVKMPDGSTKIVVIPKSVSINKAASGTKSDLKEGVTIAVFGTANSDGSVTAQSIQLNPMMRGPQAVSPTETK